MKRDLKYTAALPDVHNTTESDTPAVDNLLPTPAAWAHSSVSTFGVRYAAPLPNLNPSESVEALIEGSDMSMLREGIAVSIVVDSTRNNFLISRRSYDTSVGLDASGGKREKI